MRLGWGSTFSCVAEVAPLNALIHWMGAKWIGMNLYSEDNYLSAQPYCLCGEFQLVKVERQSYCNLPAPHIKIVRYAHLLSIKKKIERGGVC